jgi:hypothetical protein
MTDPTTDPAARAAHHAREAERLLKSWWLSTHVKAQVHATLAVFYGAQAERRDAAVPSEIRPPA